MPYIPHTEADIQAMLETIGAESIDELFDEIPKSLISDEYSSIDAGVSEMQAMREMEARAQCDSGQLCFIGAGAYEHHIPAAVWDIVSRGEWMTAYTPYQAEASQGTLQLIYEYQSMMTSLTGMDVSNASLYDGASALAEALLMAVRAHRKSKSRKILMPRLVHPFYRQVCRNIVSNQKIELIELPVAESGTVEISQLVEFEGQDITALVLPFPNVLGNLDDVNQLTDWAHNNKQLVIGVVNPVALAMLTPPGEWGEKGADIVVGEGQPLGVPLASGGPYFGFMACKQAYVRQMPGRIIGRTVDQEGHIGFTLTLQAREQHIRRSKATSNICTNQGLAVTAATIYMSLVGPEGLRRVAQQSRQNTQTLARLLSEVEGVTVLQKVTGFHEFLFVTPIPAQTLLDRLTRRGIQAGVALNALFEKNELSSETLVKDYDRALLTCVTETKTDADLQGYVQAIKEAICG